MEKATHATENPADVKAAEKMAKLFDEIKKDNPDTSKEAVHNLNIFFSRLLFCYFAEDTNIFEEHQFSHAVESHTKSDGSDLDTYLNRLFWVMNTPNDKRGDIPNYLNAFPYVNGGLFRDEIPCPKFTTKSRQILIDSGDSNDWSSINPDIFGSMFQAVISPEHRGGLGAHYTSVPNIMKVIEPLFLNELKEAYEDAIGNEKKLKELLHRISKIKLFDPACGSGNFLIIAYKELRRLEMFILKELGGFAFSGIHLNNFYGIELDDFAHEIAKLSLWLAEHQMNVEFFNQFGRTNPTLPLKEAGQIVNGNACRLDWEKVCPKNVGDEIYIMGNPPFLGSRNQDENQKEDLKLVFSKDYKNIDYVTSWFYLGSEYIRNIKAKCAFVSTNSICQGDQVANAWPRILKNGIEIDFAYKSFKWVNNAKNNAAVVVIIVGLRNSSTDSKYLFLNGLKNKASNINAYLLDAKNIFISAINKPISNLPAINFGNMPADGGKFIFTKEEMDIFILKESKSKRYFKELISAREYLSGTVRYCLWLENCSKEELDEMSEVKRLVNDVREIRLISSRPELADTPHLFAQITQPDNVQCIIIPRISSERRKYLPLGYIDSRKSKVTDSLYTIASESPYIFSIVSSTFHRVWMVVSGGKMKTDYRYAKNLCYNTFPFPSISSQRKEELTQCTFRILEEREKHPEKTLAQLYDPDKMPDGLKEAHRLNDEAVERCYRSTPFNSDEERLEYLFKLYEKMIQEEKEKGTLFAAEKKTRKKKE
jgi:type I restriction-modification system DNA methylase subunit